MKRDKNNSPKKLGRRAFLPLLGGGLLLPMLPAQAQTAYGPQDDDEYQTLLRPDGTTVRVKASNVKQSRVVNPNVDNKTLLTWLGKDQHK